MIKCFIITAVLNTGEIWETVRHTKDGLTDYIQNILSDEAVIKFTVEERE